MIQELDSGLRRNDVLIRYTGQCLIRGRNDLVHIYKKGRSILERPVCYFRRYAVN